VTPTKKKSILVIALTVSLLISVLILAKFKINEKVDTLNSTFYLFQEIKDFSTKMINTGNFLFKQLDNFRKEKINSFKV
jgi:hypothetical protein